MPFGYVHNGEVTKVEAQRDDYKRREGEATAEVTALTTQVTELKTDVVELKQSKKSFENSANEKINLLTQHIETSLQCASQARQDFHGELGEWLVDGGHVEAAADALTQTGGDGSQQIGKKLKRVIKELSLVSKTTVRVVKTKVKTSDQQTKKAMLALAKFKEKAALKDEASKSREFDFIAEAASLRASLRERSDSLRSLTAERTPMVKQIVELEKTQTLNSRRCAERFDELTKRAEVAENRRMALLTNMNDLTVKHQGAEATIRKQKIEVENAKNKVLAVNAEKKKLMLQHRKISSETTRNHALEMERLRKQLKVSIVSGAYRGERGRRRHHTPARIKAFLADLLSASDEPAKVVIDVANVGNHGSRKGHRRFLLAQVIAAFGYYNDPDGPGHLKGPAVGFLPECYMSVPGYKLPDDDLEVIEQMIRERKIFLTPNGVDDDLFILEYAADFGCIVISNDMFRDHLGDRVALRKLIQDNERVWDPDRKLEKDIDVILSIILNDVRTFSCYKSGEFTVWLRT